MRATAPSTYHPLLPSGTPPFLPIPLPAPSTSRRVDIPEADTPPQKRLLLTTPRPGCEIGESSTAADARQLGPTIETRLLDTERRIMTALELVNRHEGQLPAVRVEIEGALEARVTVLETEVRHHEWQHQAADDLAIQHIMHNYDNESSDDDNDDDDVKKDEEEHLASADPSTVPTDDPVPSSWEYRGI
ncbi:hypothetical protein Tco_0159911 [Tanacetum coccineum]